MLIENYKLIRSKRRTIALILSPDATLTVRAPLRASLHTIENFIGEKNDWINKTRHRLIANPQFKPKAFIDGEKFLFLGESYPLRVLKEPRKRFDFNEGFFMREGEPPQRRFVQWYKRQAKEIISQRVEVWAKSHDLSYQMIKITSAKRRWGSCSWRGNLNFAWRLILAPLWVVDYVIVHELAHLRHKNHSRSFWRAVEKMMPEYGRARKWLKDHGHTLEL